MGKRLQGQNILRRLLAALPGLLTLLGSCCGLSVLLLSRATHVHSFHNTGLVLPSEEKSWQQLFYLRGASASCEEWEASSPLDQG